MKTGGRHVARAKGFMLVEVMAALALLGIAFAGLSPLVIVTLRSMDNARRVTTATEFARDKLEDMDIRNTAHAAVANGSDTVTEGGTGATYARTWTAAAGPTTGTKLVTVTVSWTARIAHTVSLQTIVAQ